MNVKLIYNSFIDIKVTDSLNTIFRFKVQPKY